MTIMFSWLMSRLFYSSYHHHHHYHYYLPGIGIVGRYEVVLKAPFSLYESMGGPGERDRERG